MTERTDRERLAMTFDAAADIYDEARPGYPPALFDDLARLCGLREGSRVLEIGCGTGKATLPIAKRGYRIRCLEPGPRLASIARRNLAQFPSVAIDVTTFEDALLAPASFDLAVIASAFHWLDPALRYAKIAAALRAGACAAVIDNKHVRLEGDDRFFDRDMVQQIYRRYAPQIAGDPPLPAEIATTVDPGFIDAGLQEVAVLHYPWSETYDTARYLRFLSTTSTELALPQAERAAMFREIAALIDNEFRGTIPRHWLTLLQIARKPHN